MNPMIDPSAQYVPARGDRDVGATPARRHRVARWSLMATLVLVPFFASFPYSFNHLTGSPSVYPALIFTVATLIPMLAARSTIRVSSTMTWISLFFLWVALSGLGDLFVAPESVAVYYVLFGFAFALVISTRHALIEGIATQREVVKAIKVAGWITLTYTVIEALGYFSGIPGFFSLLSVIDPLTHASQQIGIDPNAWRIGFQHGYRVRGFSMEPSFLSPIIAFVFPWMFIAALRRARIRDFIVIGAFLIALYFSYARGVYLVVAVEIAVIVGFALRTRKLGYRQRTLVGIMSLIVVIGFLFYGGLSRLEASFTFTEHSYSNTMRYYSAKAAWDAALAHPIFGLGLGAKTEDLMPYYDAFVFTVLVAKYWLTERYGEVVALFSIQSSLLAQSGLIATGLFNFVWISLAWKNGRRFFQINRKTGQTDYYTMGVVTTLTGLFFATFALAPIMVYPYWLAWGMASANLVVRRRRARATNTSQLLQPDP